MTPRQAGPDLAAVRAEHRPYLYDSRVPTCFVDNTDYPCRVIRLADAYSAQAAALARASQSLQEARGYAEEIERSVPPGDGQECSRHIQRLVDDTFAGKLPATLEYLNAAEKGRTEGWMAYRQSQADLAAAREQHQRDELEWSRFTDDLQAELSAARASADAQRRRAERAVKVAEGLIDLFTFDDGGNAASLHPQFAFHLKVARQQLEELAAPDPAATEGGG